MNKYLLISITLLTSLVFLSTSSKVSAAPQDIDYWSAWKTNNGSTSDPIAMQEFSLNSTNRLFQAVRGNGSPYWIYIRSTADGNFDPSSCLPVTQAQTNLECWDRVGVNGQTSRQVSLTTFNNSLYLAVRGENSKIYTKSLSATGVWSAWNENGGTTTNTIAQAPFNGRLYQAVRGNGSNRMFVRSSADGIFTPGDNSENWVEINGQTEDDISLTVVQTRLFMSVRGSTGRLFTRSTTNGSVWTPWQEASSVLAKTPSVITGYNNYLYQSIINANNKVLTRYGQIDVNGNVTWSSWNTSSMSSTKRVEMKIFNGKLYQSISDTSAQILTRYLTIVETIETLSKQTLEVGFWRDPGEVGFYTDVVPDQVNPFTGDLMDNEVVSISQDNSDFSLDISVGTGDGTYGYFSETPCGTKTVNSSTAYTVMNIQNKVIHIVKKDVTYGACPWPFNLPLRRNMEITAYSYNPSNGLFLNITGFVHYNSLNYQYYLEHIDFIIKNTTFNFGSNTFTPQTIDMSTQLDDNWNGDPSSLDVTFELSSKYDSFFNQSLDSYLCDGYPYEIHWFSPDDTLDTFIQLETAGKNCNSIVKDSNFATDYGLVSSYNRTNTDNDSTFAVKIYEYLPTNNTLEYVVTARLVSGNKVITLYMNTGNNLYTGVNYIHKIIDTFKRNSF